MIGLPLSNALNSKRRSKKPVGTFRTPPPGLASRGTRFATGCPNTASRLVAAQRLDEAVRRRQRRKACPRPKLGKQHRRAFVGNAGESHFFKWRLPRTT